MSPAEADRVRDLKPPIHNSGEMTLDWQPVGRGGR